MVRPTRSRPRRACSPHARLATVPAIPSLRAHTLPTRICPTRISDASSASAWCTAWRPHSGSCTPIPSPAELKAWRTCPPREHPLVWTHRNGRKSLVLGATASHVVGMNEDEGRAALSRLLEWATRPDFVYHHEWCEGDLVIWDNRGALHRALPYDSDSGRLMHRTTLLGDEPIQ